MKKQIQNLSKNEYNIIGIASHQSHYRFSWIVNEKLSLQFSQIADFEYIKKNETLLFACYSCEYDSNTELQLVANKNETNFLLDKFKNIDFLLLVADEKSNKQTKQLTALFDSLDIVIKAFPIDIDTRTYKKIFF